MAITPRSTSVSQIAVSIRWTVSSSAVRWVVISPAALSEIRIPLPACRHDQRVNLRQSLGGLLPLRRLRHNRPNAIQHDVTTARGAFANKARLVACRSDPGARVPGHRLRGRGLSGRRLNGLCQQNEKTD